jgi:hypothetical protein
MLASCFRKYSSSPKVALYAQNAITFFLSIFGLTAAISEPCSLQYFHKLMLENVIFLWVQMQTPPHLSDVLLCLAPSL